MFRLLSIFPMRSQLDQKFKNYGTFSFQRSKWLERMKDLCDREDNCTLPYNEQLLSTDERIILTEEALEQVGVTVEEVLKKGPFSTADSVLKVRKQNLTEYSTVHVYMG